LGARPTLNLPIKALGQEFSTLYSVSSQISTVDFFPEILAYNNLDDKHYNDAIITRNDSVMEIWHLIKGSWLNCPLTLVTAKKTKNHPQHSNKYNSKLKRIQKILNNHTNDI